MNPGSVPQRSQRTRSQLRILEALETLNSDISAQDLYIHLRDIGQGVGLATVYRALEALRLAGEVQARTLPTGESRYGLVRKDYHHLNCLHCGISISLLACPVSELAAQLSETQKFKIFYHTLEFYGLCDKCQSNMGVL